MKTWILLVLLATASGCARHDAIVVGSKNFSEQVILGEMIAQQIERTTNLKVQRKLNLGGSFICHNAITAGEIDVYPEYTGTALTAILKDAPANDPRQVYLRVQVAYRALQLQWMEPFGFNNTFAILIRGEEARRLGIKTISEAAAHTPKWKAGFGYEFMERKDGFPGLASAYGLRFAETPKTMDLSLTYRALAEKQVDFIAGNSTDGLISALDLFSLQDDLRYFPPYEAAPVVRVEILRQHPELQAVFHSLAGKINDDTMRSLNYAVDGKHRDVREVVAEFLGNVSQGTQNACSRGLGMPAKLTVPR